MLSRVQAVAGGLKPWVRVIVLAYTGLGGMLAMTLVASVALVPTGPALPEVAEPARQAVSNLVQPPSDVVAILFGGGPAVHPDPVATGAWPGGMAVFSEFSDSVSLHVTIAEAPLEELAPVVAEAPLEEPAPVVAAAARRTAVVAPESPVPEPVDELVGLEPIEISAPHALVPVVVVPAPTAGLQIASHETPKALPTLPPPIETALQVKTRLDAENQAAIDAAKAALARAKAEADVANNAAIAVRKAAATALVTVSAPATVSAPVTPAAAATAVTSAPTVKISEAATPAATPQSKAAANAANQAAIDAAKLAQGRAKAESNAANAAALLAAKSGKTSAKTTTMPTAQPTPATAVSVGVMGLAGVGSAADDSLGNEAFLENVPVDQASTPPDPGAA